jgi:hypothetical protein
MDPAKFDAAQRIARSIVGAHDALSRKMNKSLYRLIMSNKLTTASIAAISVYAAAHGAG